jgi:two-component system, sensor histidine kinase LadS
MRIILFSVFLISIYVHADVVDTVTLSKVDSKISLKNKSYYFISNPRLSIDSIITIMQTNEMLLPLSKINFGYNNDVYWLIVPLKNNLVNDVAYFLEIQNPHIDRIQAWCFSNNTLLPLGTETGDDFEFNTRSYIHRNFLWELGNCHTNDFTIIFRIEKRHSSLRLPVYIWPSYLHTKHYAREDLILGLSLGMIILVVIYSIVAGLFFRSKIYISYTAFVITAILLITTSKGLSLQFLYPNWGGFNSIFNVAITILVTFSLIIFSQQFLQTRFHTPRIHRLLNYVLLIYLITIIGTPFLLKFYIQHSLIMLPIMLLVNFSGNILCLSAALVSYPRQKNISLFYILAYLFAHSYGIVAIIQEFGLIESISFDLLVLGVLTEILVFSVGITYQMKKVYDERSELSMKIAEQQKESLNNYLHGVERERTRIAKELQEDIGHRLEKLQNKILLPENQDKIYLENQIVKLSNDVRRISHHLMPPASLNKGLVQPVANLITDLKASSTINFNLQIFDVPELLNPELNRQAFHIIQEALDYIVKHAKATEVDIQIFGYEKELVITIDDNGIGISMNELHEGTGIKQMETRAKLVNALLEINTSNNAGYQLMLTIPLRPLNSAKVKKMKS